jgi:hypothetical protein
VRPVRTSLRHPVVENPIALLLSRWTLSRLLAVYVIVLAGLVGLGGTALHRLDRNRPSWGVAAQDTFAEILNPGVLVSRGGQSPAFYAFTAAIALVGTVLPIFLLGSFVFKLFRHDPLVWRRTVSLQDLPGSGAILAFRFYNGTKVPLVAISIRVLAVVKSTGRPSTTEHITMRVIADQGLAQTREWELSPPAEPFTVRVPVAPIDRPPLSSTTVWNSPTIDIRGKAAAKHRVGFFVIATGTYAVTGSSFVSTRSYDLVRDTILGHFQPIEVDSGTPPRSWDGWANFEGNRNMYLFAYDSLVRPSFVDGIVAAPLDLPPVEARLSGWRREWNAGSDASMRPGTTLYDAAGMEYHGVIALLGLARSAGGGCNGVAYPVSSEIVVKIDEFQQCYDRIDVSGEVEWPGKPQMCTVFTYVPTAQSKARLERAVVSRDACVTKEIADLVEESFEELGAESIQTYRASTSPPGCPTLDLATVRR